MPAMEIEQLAVMDIGQHIAVRHQQFLGRRRLQQANRTRSPQWGLFADVADLHLPTAAIAKMALDHAAKIVDREHEVAEPLRASPLKNMLQHGLAGHR